MRILLNIYILLVSVLFNMAHASNDATIYFIGNNKLVSSNNESIDGYILKSFNLDGQQNLEKQLVKGIDVKTLSPEGMKAAELEANRRLEEMDRSLLQQAFMPLLLAAKFDIKKVPAFVFDEGDSVIYGVTNTIEAIQIYEAWRNRQ